jgi:hypothetical protein
MSTEAEVRAAAQMIESALVGQKIDMFTFGEQVMDDGSIHTHGNISFGKGSHSVHVSGARFDSKTIPLAGVTVTSVDYVVMPMDGYTGWSIKGYQGSGGAHNMVFEVWNANGEDIKDAIWVS